MSLEKRIIIFDIDGTLSDCKHRQHYLKGEKKDWHNFFKSAEFDKPIKEMRELVEHFNQRNDYRITLCTGRSEMMRSMTLEWLQRYNIKFDRLLMRHNNDFRSDALVKKEMIDILGKENIWFVVDDRKKVVEMWREEGLLCLQCAEGDF